MKRIKRILCTLVIVLSVLFICACSKEYSSVTYKKFVDKMGNQLGYTVVDKTISYEDIYQRYYSANKENVLFIFYEFKDAETAKEFMKDYDNKKGYSYKSTDDYTIVKNSKSGYLKIIQVDNVVISGSSEKSSGKKEIKKVFKELGY